LDPWLDQWALKLSDGETPPDRNKLLLIDDQTEILENLKEYLELDGFKVTIATSGNNLLNRVMELKPDLIVCDVMMPGISGHEVLQVLRGSPVTSQIPFIFSSSSSELIKMTEALAMGANDYLVKPFDPEELLMAIKSLLKLGNKNPTVV